jgi:hypothetical protein
MVKSKLMSHQKQTHCYSPMAGTNKIPGPKTQHLAIKPPRESHQGNPKSDQDEDGEAKPNRSTPPDPSQTGPKLRARETITAHQGRATNEKRSYRQPKPRTGRGSVVRMRNQARAVRETAKEETLTAPRTNERSSRSFRNVDKKRCWSDKLPPNHTQQHIQGCLHA